MPNEKISTTFLIEKFYDSPPTRKKKGKVSNEQFTILKFNDWEKILVINYNVSQLKSICRFYKQKLSGNKNELVKRLYNFLKLGLGLT